MDDVIKLSDVAAGLNEISWDLLEILNKKQDMNYKDLQRTLNISQEKIYKEIARLEGAILIKSSRDPIDRRALNFNITDYGIKILKVK